MTTAAAHAGQVDKYEPGIPVSNAKLAMWLFLATEIMFFMGLIGSYIVLRFGSPGWPTIDDVHLNPHIGALNTVVLIVSSVTVVLALSATAKEDHRMVRLHLSITIGLGCLFMVIKAWEYYGKISTGVFPGMVSDHGLLEGGNLWPSCYFTMTGFHGIHVVGGIVMLVMLLLQSLAGKLNADKYERVELIGLYWHFVDVVWIFLFPLLYLIA